MSKKITMNFGYAAGLTIPVILHSNSVALGNYKGYKNAIFDSSGQAVVDVSDLSVSNGDVLHVSGSNIDTIKNSTSGGIIDVFPVVDDEQGGNAAPTANAGPNQTNIAAGATVTLDSSASNDTDGTISGQAWTQISGTTVTLDDVNSVSPQFTAPSSPSSQTLTFRVTVTDNNNATSFADVSISVLAQAGGGGVPVETGFAPLFSSYRQANITNAFTLTEGGTLSFYVKGLTNSTDVVRLFGHGAGQNGQLQYKGSSNKFTLFNNGLSVIKGITLTEVINDGAQHIITITLNSGVLSATVDGQAAGSSSDANAVPISFNVIGSDDSALNTSGIGSIFNVGIGADFWPLVKAGATDVYNVENTINSANPLTFIDAPNPATVSHTIAVG